MAETPMRALLDILAPDSEDCLLTRALEPSRVPAHVAVIMDGNGRWAKLRNRPRGAGHKAGMETVRSTVETCSRLGVRFLTLYAFSVENWRRPKAEVEMLWRLLRTYLNRELATLTKNGVRLAVLGRLDALPRTVRQDLEEVVEQTASHTGMHLNLAINYGGRAELVDAIRALVREYRDNPGLIDEQAVAAKLYTAGMPDPDLLIRTSGEMRVSNFLLWQIAYSEIYITEVLWPDFNRTELLRAVLEYQRRDRRFGGLSAEPDFDAEPASAHKPRAAAQSR